MKQKHATRDDVAIIINHTKDLIKLSYLGFYETRLFTYNQNIIPKKSGLISEIKPYDF